MREKKKCNQDLAFDNIEWLSRYFGYKSCCLWLLEVDVFFWVLSSEETMVDFLYHAVFCEGDAAVMALFICHLSANCRLSTPG